jgi:hypothetical protein
MVSVAIWGAYLNEISLSRIVFDALVAANVVNLHLYRGGFLFPVVAESGNKEGKK